MKAQPRLAAVLHADVAGSTQLLKTDQIQAHTNIQQTFNKLSNVIKHYGGKVLEIRGDALLAEFSQASKAVYAACHFQSIGAERTNTSETMVQLRIGVSLGEIIVSSGAVSGAGIVMAQRLEQLAAPGSVISHSAIIDILADSKIVQWSELGDRELKGFDQSIRAFTISFVAGFKPEISESLNSLTENEQQSQAWRSNRRYQSGLAVIFLLFVCATLWIASRSPAIEKSHPEQQSSTTEQVETIAVLPFTNPDGNLTDNYFAAGLTEDLITDLSNIPGLRVVSAEASRALLENVGNLHQNAQAEGIGYLLSSNIRNTAEQIRINTKLIDVNRNTNVWAERFDYAMNDVFSVQDEINNNILSALSLQLNPEASRRLQSKPEISTEAYDYFQKGRSLLHSQQMVEGREYFRKAIEVNGNYSRAYAALALSHLAATTQSLSLNNQKDVDIAFELATKAVAIDDDSIEGNFALGVSFIFRAQHEKSKELLNKTLALDPDYGDAYMMKGYVDILSGDYPSAIEQLNKAIVLQSQANGILYTYLGTAYFFTNQLDQAVSILSNASQYNPELVGPRLILAATYQKLDQPDDAAWESEEVMLQYPNFVLRNWQWIPMFNPADRADVRELLSLLKLAGIPE